MNGLQIFGFILITVGTVISFLGSYNQSKKDDIFQNSLTEYVEKQTQSEVPILKVLRVEGQGDSARIIVKNIGKTMASRVTLIYNQNSTPSAFVANFRSEVDEIPQGVEVSLPLNLLSGIQLLCKVPNSNNEYREKLKSEFEKFRKGESVFLPKFHLEYYFNNEMKKSENYFLLVNNKGIVYFGKSHE